MLRTLMLALAISGSAAALELPRWSPPTTGEKVLAGAALAMFAADGLYSLGYARRGVAEGNPLSPWRHPTDAQFVGMWAGSVALGAAAWWLLPSPARNMLPVCTIAIESFVLPTQHFVFGVRMRLPFN